MASDPELTQHSASPKELLFFSLLFFLPSLNVPPFVWLTGVLAVPVFYLLTTKGPRSGGLVLGKSLLIAGIGSLLLNHVEIFFFSLTLLPVGYILFSAAARGETAAKSGLRGLLTLASTWGVLWAAYGAAEGINVYAVLLGNLDTGFQQVLELYNRQRDKFSPEDLSYIRQAIDSIRSVLPHILPGLLALMVVVTVWLNMVMANALLGRLRNGEFPWGKYADWKLPDQLIWLPIGALFCLLFGGAGYLRDAGVIALLFAWQLYFFQGLAVFISLLDRWNAPFFLRLLLYPLLLLMPYGLLLLSLLGLFEVWCQFRRKKERGEPPQS